MTLRSPFAEALQVALRHAPEDHAYPGWMLEKRWRGYLESAQEMADLRAAGQVPDWRGENHDTPTLAWGLLSFIGEDPPADLLEEVDQRVRALETGAPTADRRHLPTDGFVKNLLRTFATVRHLVEQFRPGRRLS